jgi:hypothetical protein
MNLSTIVRSPRSWITVQLLAIMVFGDIFGCWHVQMLPDSQSYITASRLALEPALSQARTMGYPMILRLVATFSPDYSALPWVQLAMLWPAVFLLDFAVRRFGASPWQAFAVSSGFMYGAIQQVWSVASVLTDFPATVVAGMAIACLLLISSNPKHPGAWLGLTIFLAAAYHIRPACLFLIPLAPCLGIVLLRLRAKGRREPFVWKKVLLALVAVSSLPFLAFCTLRWAVVDDFGLVSLGGTNVVGLAAELLDTKMVDNELSEPFRPFAREILKGRQERGLKPAFPGGWRVDMRAYEDNFPVNTYFIAVPAAKRIFGDDTILRNREMVRFSREVVGLRRGNFLLWAVQYWPRAVMKVAYRYWILQAAIPATCILFVIRRYRRRYPHCFLPHVSWALNDLNTTVLPALLWLNLLYFGALISVLILSGLCADSRLIVPAAVYLPSLVGLLILRELQAICSAPSIPKQMSV